MLFRSCVPAWVSSIKVTSLQKAQFKNCENVPAAKEKILGRIRSTRGGRLNDSRFGVRMRGEGPIADLIRQVFYVNARKLGLNQHPWPVSPEAFRRPACAGQEQQLRLFE